MKTAVEDLGSSQKKITFEIPSEDVQDEVDKYCKKLAKQVDVRGFRKGKAPASVIKRYYMQQILQEVTTQLVSTAFEQGLKENEITMLGEPEIDAPALEEGKDFSFSVKMDIKPELENVTFEGIEIERESSEVEETELQTSLEQLQKAHGELKGVEEDRAAADGDTVLVDYEIKIDDVPIPNGDKQDVYIEIGAGSHNKDVEEALKGAKVGDSREAQIEYPESFINRELAGKKAVYHFQVKKIMVKELPSLDDEFAKDVGPYETLDDLKARMKEEIVREKELRIKQRLEEDLLEKILEKNTIDAPPTLIQARHAQMMKDATGHFLSQGLALEQDSEEHKKLNEEMLVIAEKEVKKQLFVELIGEKESITVPTEEVDKRIEEIAARHEQSPEKIRGDIQKQEDGLDRFQISMLREKTLDFILSQVTIIDKAKNTDSDEKADK